MKKPRPFDLEALFKALADKTRLRLLNLMKEKEMCVCYLWEALQAPQPTISRHLAYLRRAGIVAARRDGKWMHYRIQRPANPAGARIFETTLAALAADPAMRADEQRLNRACCAPQNFVSLIGAPQPVALKGEEIRT